MFVSAMAILLLASLVVMLHFVRKSVKEEALQKSMQTLEGTVQRIDNILLSVEQTTGNAYFAMFPYLNQPDMIHQYTRRVVESNPYVVGCAVAMKPYFYKDRELFMAYYRHEDALSAESPIILLETFGNTPYTDQKWFKIPMASAKPGWIKPMKGEDGVDEPIMTFSLPIPGHAKTVSIATAPPKALPRVEPRTVIIGMRAFFRACFLITYFSLTPLALAVLR